jgi:predicted dehydrogenase
VSVRVGILGAGQAGERHAAGFAADPRADVVAVADLDATAAARVAQRVDAEAVSTAEDLVARGIDVLVVALPHHLHLEPTRLAARRGIHVLMEKPIATTLDDADAIVDACGASGVTLSVGFVHRYREEVARAKSWLSRAGTLQVARESMASQRTPRHPAWLTRRGSGGGVLLYGAIHGIDRLRWFLDSDVAEVTARTHRYAPDTEVEDGVAALLGFRSGASATLTANAPLYRAQPAPWETEVYGSSAMVRVRTRAWAETSSDRGQDRYETDGDPRTAAPHYNFGRQASAFLTAVQEGASPPVTGADGVRALEVCLAIQRSAAEGRTVAVEEAREPSRREGP